MSSDVPDEPDGFEPATTEIFHVTVDSSDLRKLKSEDELVASWESDPESKSRTKIVMHWDGSDHRIDETLR